MGEVRAVKSKHENNAAQQKTNDQKYFGKKKTNDTR